MDAVLVAIVSRALERVLVVAAGALAIYLGYRLFLNMPDHDKSAGKVVLPGGISIFLSRVGPGIFFSLFGAIVIALSFHYGIRYDEEARPAVAAGVAQAPPTLRRSLSGLAPVAELADLGERNRALAAVTGLNQALAALRPDVTPAERRRITESIEAAKLGLMRSVWDKAHWGDFDAFAAWAGDHPDDPPPSGLAEAVGYYRAGAAAGRE